jgi:hypothetical protein
LGEKKPAIEEKLADLEDLRDLFNSYECVPFGICFTKSTVSNSMGVQRAFALSLEKVVDVT